MKAAIEARAALAELKGAGKLIPNQAVLINSIPLLEAQASSAIENIVTTTDRLFRFTDPAAEAVADPATKEALHYRTALYEGFAESAKRPLATTTAIRICRPSGAIRATYIRPRRGRRGCAKCSRKLGMVFARAGRYRSPYPHGGRALSIRGHSSVYRWKWPYGARPEPFVPGPKGIAGVADPVFERIHHSAQNRLLPTALESNVGRSWEEWVLFMLHAVLETARWTTTKVAAVRDLLDKTAAAIRRDAPKNYSRELADLIFIQPYCRISNLVDAGIVQRQSASVYLKRLAEIGILEEPKVGREKLFVNPDYLQLLTGPQPQ